MTYQIIKTSHKEIKVTVQKGDETTCYTYNPQTHRARINDGVFTFTKKTNS